jgi:hypothetical protein
VVSLHSPPAADLWGHMHSRPRHRPELCLCIQSNRSAKRYWACTLWQITSLTEWPGQVRCYSDGPRECKDVTSRCVKWAFPISPVTHRKWKCDILRKHVTLKVHWRENVQNFYNFYNYLSLGRVNNSLFSIMSRPILGPTQSHTSGNRRHFPQGVLNKCTTSHITSATK